MKKEIAFGNNGTLSDKIRAEVFKELNNENNQLKEEIEELENKIKKLRKNLALEIEENNRYLEALEEIEGVVKEMHSICIEEISITASQLNDRIYRESCERFKQILDIINKAKGKNQ